LQKLHRRHLRRRRRPGAHQYGWHHPTQHLSARSRSLAHACHWHLKWTRPRHRQKTTKHQRHKHKTRQCLQDLKAFNLKALEGVPSAASPTSTPQELPPPYKTSAAISTRKNKANAANNNADNATDTDSNNAANAHDVTNSRSNGRDNDRGSIYDPGGNVFDSKTSVIGDTTCSTNGDDNDDLSTVDSTNNAVTALSFTSTAATSAEDTPPPQRFTINAARSTTFRTHRQVNSVARRSHDNNGDRIRVYDPGGDDLGNNMGDESTCDADSSSKHSTYGDCNRSATHARRETLTINCLCYRSSSLRIVWTHTRLTQQQQPDQRRQHQGTRYRQQQLSPTTAAALTATYPMPPTPVSTAVTTRPPAQRTPLTLPCLSTSRRPPVLSSTSPHRLPPPPSHHAHEHSMADNDPSTDGPSSTSRSDFNALHPKILL
jgi:hypothetical protein